MNRPLTISGLILFAVILSCMCQVTVGDSDCTNVSPELETCAKEYSFLTQEALADGETGICSTEGRQSVSCIMEFRQLCPTSALGEDLVSKVNSSGGIDAYCTVHGNQPVAAEDSADLVACAGKCSQYAVGSAEFSKFGQEVQRVAKKARYLTLPYILELECGPIKAFALCWLDILPTCPGVEQQLKNLQFGGLATNSAISPDSGMMAKFIRSYCSIDNGLSSDADCASIAMDTNLFSNCLTKTLAEIKGNKNCASYNRVKQCVTNAVAPTCGNEAARLVSAGMSLVYPAYIPIDCETAASKLLATSHASGTQASSLTLLGVLSVFIMHRIYNF